MIDQADYRPKVYAYVRTTGPDDGAERELRAIQRYIDRHLPGVGDGKVYLFRDSGQAAYELNLAAREQGRRLRRAVQAGDHVVFYSLTKAFRRVRDALGILMAWRSDGVHFHDVSLATADGPVDEERIVEAVKWAYRWQRESRSERTRATNDLLRRREGRNAGGKLPWYLTWKRDGRGRHVALDEDRVQLMFLMRQLRDEGTGYQEIAVAISKQLDPDFEPAPGMKPSQYPISRAQVYKLLQRKGWRRFAYCPLLLRSRGIREGETPPWEKDREAAAVGRRPVDAAH